MSLSHDERKQLAEMERGITLEDPDFARKLRAGIAGSSSRVPGWPDLLLLLAGMLVLLAGIAAQSTLIGIAGFLLMGAGGYLIVREPGLFKDWICRVIK